MKALIGFQLRFFYEKSRSLIRAIYVINGFLKNSFDDNESCRVWLSRVRIGYC